MLRAGPIVLALILIVEAVLWTPRLVRAQPRAIYVADTGNRRLVKVDDMSGAGWTAFGNRGSGPNQFELASGVAVDGAGHVYVADLGNVRIVRISDASGAGWKPLGQRGIPLLAPGGPFSGPVAIAVDWPRWIYVSDLGRIMRLPLAMNEWVSLGFGTLFNAAPELARPRGIAVDSAGRIYFADVEKHRIIRVDDIRGTGWTTFGSQGNGVNQFQQPWGVAVDGSGRICVCDRGNHRIVRIDDMTGSGWVTVGGPRAAGEGQFDTPTGVAVTPAGRIYVADSSNHRVVSMDDMTGAGWVVLGVRGSGAHQFNGPTALAVDPR